jgi:hypothetical protein
MSTTDPLAGFKSRLEAALLATLRDQATQQPAAERPPRPAPALRRRGRRRVAVALAGLTALAVAAIALGPALLAPERPGAAAFALRPVAGGKLRVTLRGSLERPEVRQELARALGKYGADELHARIDAQFGLFPGPARLVGRVLSKDRTQPLGEFTLDTSDIKPGDQVTVFIAVGVRQGSPLVDPGGGPLTPPGSVQPSPNPGSLPPAGGGEPAEGDAQRGG